MQRYQPPTPDGAAAAGAQLAALAPWLQQRPAVAVPGGDGRLELRLGGGDAALELPLPAGRWRATIEPAAATATVAIDGCVADATGAWTVSTAGEQTVRLRRTGDIAIPIAVRRVRLARVGD